MKKILLSLVALAMSVSMLAQEPVFYENFNNCPTTNAIGNLPEGWTCIKNDNLPNHPGVDYYSDAWKVMVFRNYNHCACCITRTDLPGNVDRWLITPEITITEATNFLEFVAGGGGQDNPEIFSVMVSTTGANMEDFSDVLIDHAQFYNSDYEEYSVSLAAYAGQTIRIAFVAQTSDEYILRIDNVKVFTPDPDMIALKNLTLPTYAPNNAGTAITGVVMNRGGNNLTSFDMEYYVNGGTPVTQHVSGIDVPRFGTYDFSFNTLFQDTHVGVDTITIVVSNPNGVTGLENDTLVGVISVFDGAAAVERTILMEQFTGAKCGYCPAGEERLEEAAAQFEGRLAWVTHHSGYQPDELSNVHSNKMVWFYGGSTFAPGVMFDRTHFKGAGPVMNVDDPKTILNYMNKTSEVPCFLNLSIDNLAFDEISRQITGTVNGQFTTNEIDLSKANLVVYLVEDSTVMQQTDYNNGTQRDYRHYHTLRTSINGSWGEHVTPDENGNFSYTIDYTLPDMTRLNNERIVNAAWRTHLVAFVFFYDNLNVKNCYVYNATQSSNLQATYLGMDEVGTDVVLNIFPNPATDRVVIGAGQQIEEVKVVNTLGQVVYSNRNVQGESIELNTEAYASGMYIATVKTSNGICTKRFNIAK